MPGELSAGTALVTGASAGIGRELARLLAQGGFGLILTARDESRLQQLAAELRERWSVAVTVIPCDLSVASGAGTLAADIEAAGLEVDLLVNNAGMGAAGSFADVPLERQLALLQLDIVSLTELTHRFLPAMLARRRGRILNVASTAAFQPGPYLASYYASKAYVLSLSEALAEETRGTGVTVTALCPGPTRTEFFARASMRESRLARNAVMEAAEVAAAGYAGMMRGDRIVVPGAGNRVLAALVRIAPRGIVTRVVARLNRTRQHRSGADAAAG
ncbi:MAG TPA: SDR family oxidoreductase [Gemmatimonadales bacterium]|nr:SDR family oxidoreductase [Gemmatimonadales bacterium]